MRRWLGSRGGGALATLPSCCPTKGGGPLVRQARPARGAGPVQGGGRLRCGPCRQRAARFLWCPRPSLGRGRARRPRRRGRSGQRVFLRWPPPESDWLLLCCVGAARCQGGLRSAARSCVPARSVGAETLPRPLGAGASILCWTEKGYPNQAWPRGLEWAVGLSRCPG